jgi:hypothetical protein
VNPTSEGVRRPWWLIPTYFVVFFAAMTLGGLLFLLGGIALILIPGSLPVWAEAGYIVLGLFGSVGVAILAANGSIRLLLGRSRSAEPSGTRRMPRVLPWLAGIAGTIIGGGGSAILSALVSRWLSK